MAASTNIPAEELSQVLGQEAEASFPEGLALSQHFPIVSPISWNGRNLSVMLLPDQFESVKTVQWLDFKSEIAHYFLTISSHCK